MTPGVNLVPQVHRLARVRARRRTVWTGLAVTLAVLVASAWAVENTAVRGLRRLADRVQATELQRAEVQRRLTTAETDRRLALEALQTVAAARRPQPWARRLATLVETAPEGVFLTALTVSDGRPDARAAGPAAKASGGRSTPAAAGRGTPAPTENPRAAREVFLRGYALDHGALIQLLNTLQNMPGWHHVELVRATSEPIRAGLAVAFELTSAAEENDP